ncbi:MAG: CopD family protein [Rubrivivax sp.]|nr:CopD family protein [Rubrivivax sp.]
MFYTTMKTLHVLSVVLWVGGMAFVQLFLRPALPVLPPPDRLRLMHDVLRRFFAGVGWAVVIVLATGFGMAAGGLSAVGAAVGVAAGWPLDWTLMAVLGLTMAGIFVFIRYVLFARLERALAGGDMPGAAEALTHVRGWVRVNLGLGVAIIVVALMV